MNKTKFIILAITAITAVGPSTAASATTQKGHYGTQTVDTGEAPKPLIPETSAGEETPPIQLPIPFWYIDAGAGRSAADKPHPGRLDDTGFGWVVNVGCQIFTNFALEAGYTHYQVIDIIEPVTRFVAAEDKLRALHVQAKFIAPLPWNFRAFGKIGLGNSHSDLKIRNETEAALLGLLEKRHAATTVYYGGGIDYTISPSFALNLQWNRIKDRNDVGRLDLISAGITYQISQLFKKEII